MQNLKNKLSKFKQFIEENKIENEPILLKEK